MSTIPQTGVWAMENLRLLAYMQHMAQTAQPAATKRLFESFAQQENRRIETHGARTLMALNGRQTIRGR